MPLRREDAARSGEDAGHMACAEDGAPGGADAALATSAVVFALWATAGG